MSDLYHPVPKPKKLTLEEKRKLQLKKQKENQREQKLRFLQRKKETRTRQKERKRQSIPKVKKRLDKLVLEILKLVYPQVCVTCGNQIGWFHPQNNEHGLQVGHYISRTLTPLRWDFRNVAPQCADCNIKHNNNTVPYTRYMIKRYGIELLEELDHIAAEDRKKSYQEQKVHQVELLELEKKLTLSLLDLQVGKGDTYGIIPK